MQRPKKETLRLLVLLAVNAATLAWKTVDDCFGEAMMLLGVVVLVVAALNGLLWVAGKLGRD